MLCLGVHSKKYSSLNTSFLFFAYFKLHEFRARAQTALAAVDYQAASAESNMNVMDKRESFAMRRTEIGDREFHSLFCLSRDD